MWQLPLSNTTTLFCPVRPKSCSRLRLLSLYQHVELLAYVLGVRLCRQLGLQLYHLCQAAQLNLLRYVVGRCFDAYVPGRSLYLNMKAES